MTIHGTVRCLVLLWACALITWTVIEVFKRTPHVPLDTAGALTTVVGILAVAVGLYEWRAPPARPDNAGHS